MQRGTDSSAGGLGPQLVGEKIIINRRVTSVVRQLGEGKREIESNHEGTISCWSLMPSHHHVFQGTLVHPLFFLHFVVFSSFFYSA